MSSKRHGNAFQYLEPKKSKLDISIHSAASRNKYQPTSGPHRPQPTNNFRYGNQPAQTTYATMPPPPATKSDQELMDDEDDVILLLASQAFDGLQQAEDNLSMDIPSFGFFQPNKKSSTSTQKPVIISDHEDDFLNDFLMENDLNEKMLSQMPGVVQPAASENMFALDTEPAAGTFRMPDIPPAGTSRMSDKPPAQVLNNGYGSNNRQPRNENIQKNISSAKDAQIKFMMKELEDAKRQKVRFEEEIRLLTEKCQTKDGEVCFIIEIIVHLY